MKSLDLLSWCLRGAFALLLSSSLWAGDVLKVRADVWMPYNGEPKGSPEGYVVEIMRAIYEPQSVVVDYQNMGWTEALEAVHKGEITAVIGANLREAEGLVVPEESVGEPRMGLFVRKDIVWSYENLQSLERIRVAAIEGYSYWDAADEYLRVNAENKKRVMMLTGETPLATGLAKLDAKEIDALLETFPVFVWAVKKSGRSVADYRVAFKQEGEPIYVAFAPNDEGRAMAAKLSEGIRALRAAGKLEPMLKPYGLSDWKQ